MVEHAANTERSAAEWHLDVGLSHPDSLPVAEALAEDLMDTVVRWAEAHGLHVGGGIKPYANAFVKRRQIDAPPAGRDLDALVAVRVMGRSSAGDPPPYSTDLASAFEVVELLRRSGRWCCIKLQSDYHYVWDMVLTLSELEDNPDHSETLRVSSESLPEAICLAALQALQDPPAGAESKGKDRAEGASP